MVCVRISGTTNRRGRGRGGAPGSSSSCSCSGSGGGSGSDPGSGHSLATFLQPELGPDVVRMVTAAAAAGTDDLDLGHGDSKLFEHMLGPEPRNLFTQRATAKTLGLDVKKVKRGTIEIAAAVFFSNRGWIASLLSAMRAQLFMRRIRLIGNFCYNLYDETSLPLRSIGDTTSNTGNAIQSLAAAPLPPDGSADGRKEKGICKVIQSEAMMAFVFEHLASKTTMSWHVPLACPLAMADRATGACLRANIYRTWDLPGLAELRADGGFSMDVSTADRASANDLCEGNIATDNPRLPRLRLPCVAHMASTAEGRVLGAVDGMTSGCIASSLSQQPAKAPTHLRESVIAVLEYSVRPVPGPPPDDCPFRQRLSALLDLCLTDTEADKKRRAVLETSLHSDTAQDEIYVYTSQPADFDKREWAEKVGRAMFPRAIPAIPRQRWISSLTCFQGHSLLTLHNVLQRSFPRWLAIMDGLSPAPLTLEQPARCRSDWDLASSDEEDMKQNEGAGPPAADDVLAAVVPLPPQQPLSKQELAAELNKQNRGSARHFAKSKPTNALVVTLVTFRLCSAFLNRIEKVADTGWDIKQMQTYATGGASANRMTLASSGYYEEAAYKDAEELFSDPLRWTALPASGRTFHMAGLGFVMLSAGLCAMAQLAFSQFRGYPYLLWLLLANPTLAFAKKILDDRACGKDPWTRAFLGYFNTPEKLLGDGRAILLSLAQVLRYDIARIECRNAAIKKMRRMLASSYAADFAELSADFMMMRTRIIEDFLNRLVAKGTKAAGTTAQAQAKAKARRMVRRFGKYKGTPAGGLVYKSSYDNELLLIAHVPCLLMLCFRNLVCVNPSSPTCFVACLELECRISLPSLCCRSCHKSARNLTWQAAGPSGVQWASS